MENIQDIEENFITDGEDNEEGVKSGSVSDDNSMDVEYDNDRTDDA